MGAPAVSVLIIVHNRAHTIGAAVRSVLAQTLTDLELVVVDDGSTDETAAVVEGFDDPRLRLVRTSPNQGIPLARNRALDEARGRYIAWLDSDDICHPERLQVQRDYLERHPDIAMIGSAARKFRADNRLMASGRVPVQGHEEIRALLLFRSAFQQSSIFGRAEALHEMRYDPAFPVCEDVDMFVRFTDRFRAANLPQFLIARRIHSGQTIRGNVDRIIERQKAISGRLLGALGVSYGEDDLSRHVALGGKATGERIETLLDWAPSWFDRILAANERRQLYDDAALRACFGSVLLKTALRQVARKPSQATRLPGLFLEHPGEAAKLAGAFARPFLPLVGQPSARGLRQVLGT